MAWARMWPDDGVEVFTLVREEGAVTCAKGLRVLPDHTWADARDVDVLVVPGGKGTRPLARDAPALEWLRGQQAPAPS